MRLEKWALVAEVVSGVAVVVTLVILILEVRENTDVARASAYERALTGLLDTRRQMVNDPDVARLWQAYTDGEAETLEPVDNLRLRQLVYTVLGTYENAFYAQRYGTLGSSEWGRFERQICIQIPRASVNGFEDQLRLVMTEEFLEYVEDVCGDAP